VPEARTFFTFLPTRWAITNDLLNFIQIDTHNLLCISPCSASYQTNNFQLRVTISPTAALANSLQKGDPIGVRKRCPEPAKTRSKQVQQGLHLLDEALLTSVALQSNPKTVPCCVLSLPGSIPWPICLTVTVSRPHRKHSHTIAQHTPVHHLRPAITMAMPAQLNSVATLLSPGGRHPSL
jgi:hypothetical protein